MPIRNMLLPAMAFMFLVGCDAPNREANTVLVDMSRKDYIISCLHGDNYGKKAVSTKPPSAESIDACEKLAYRIYPKVERETPQ